MHIDWIKFDCCVTSRSTSEGSFLVFYLVFFMMFHIYFIPLFRIPCSFPFSFALLSIVSLCLWIGYTLTTWSIIGIMNQYIMNANYCWSKVHNLVHYRYHGSIHNECKLLLVQSKFIFICISAVTWIGGVCQIS